MKRESVNKKVFALGILGLIIGLFLINLVFAQNFLNSSSSTSVQDSVQKAINKIDQVGYPIWKAIFGEALGKELIPGFQEGADLTIRILVFFLVTLVIYGVLSNINIFGSSKWVNLLIGVIISIIGIRFLPAGFLNEFAIPSSAFVSVLVIGVPFVLLFFILQKVDNSIFRKAMWITFGVIIFMLWAYNMDNSQISDTAKWIYPLVGIVSLAFVFVDKAIRELYQKEATSSGAENLRKTERDKLIGEMRELQQTAAGYAEGGDETKADEYYAKAKKVEQRIKKV